ncbi:heme anaerobic degradation radical SAM methyltransferase ChuW/HutW [Crenobacter caeni]|uniref:heme anaerobic degradation radical SAM methyltransferase ChuW/HutW n=1 Tax=Crenobacter caeni TaxID=2705474 RepID=UPI001EF35ED4|nr:heme anaerobic degradation radical SAM methyltransferase ChuW/HutW [Crenobacter caeni]
MYDTLPEPLPFKQRRALMPMWGQAPLPEVRWPATWQSLQEQPLPHGSLAYVHIPFCANHCVFCGFYRNGWKAETASRYVDRLIAEIEHDAATRQKSGSVSALYLGGGTPTLLSARDLGRLLQALRANLPLSDDCEITVEGRISHFGEDKVDACIKAGANRFSIGVQTFATHIRRRLGRKHPGDEAARYLEWLAAHSGQVVVADLMFGLPGQDDSVWRQDLATALSLGLSGVDVYAFNLMPQLPIVRMIEKGALPSAGSLAEQLAQYRTACRAFDEAGWAQLSNSHFGAPCARERNRYNLAIKAGADCLAFGSGAGGKRGAFSYAVEPDLERYLACPVSQKPIARLGRGDAAGQLAALQGAVETGRIALASLPEPAQTRPLIERWAALGLLTLGHDHAELTVDGRFWGPTMIREMAERIAPAGAGHAHPLTLHHPLKETA